MLSLSEIFDADRALRASNDRLGALAHDTLRVAEEADRVRIDAADRCGGLQGDPEAMLRAYTQFGTDRLGLGLGLAISRRSIEANGGSLTVRDVPGHGCIFTIDPPRQPSA